MHLRDQDHWWCILSYRNWCSCNYRLQLNSFLQQLQKRAVEKMLEGELYAHLGYEKHQGSDNPNSRNGYSTKTIKNALGQSQINVPRDRDGSFEPTLVPKRKSMAEDVENVIISMYAKGMSNQVTWNSGNFIRIFRVNFKNISHGI